MDPDLAAAIYSLIDASFGLEAERDRYRDALNHAKVDLRVLHAGIGVVIAEIDEALDGTTADPPPVIDTEKRPTTWRGTRL